MSHWTLKIPRACPSQNLHQWAHWARIRAEKKLWWALIRSAPGFLEIPRATGRRRLTLERWGWRILDEANLIGGAKGIIDNLVQLGLLVDDRPDMLDLGRPIQHQILPRSGVRPHTLLHIEDVGQRPRIQRPPTLDPNPSAA